jgi:hypothetical protein
MESQDLELEELGVAKSVGLPLHGLDLVVDALEGASGNGVVIPRQDTASVCCKSLCEFLELAYA